MNYRNIEIQLVFAAVLFASNAFGQDKPQGSRAPAQQASPAAQAAASVDEGWKVAISPYLWFAGVHGTVGALGHQANVDASAADVLSKFNIGFMALVEPSHQDDSFPVDFLWIKLTDDNALSYDQGATSAQVKLTETILTPKYARRIVNREKIKLYGNIGVRYWHLGQNFSIQPSGLFGNISQSANWVDVVGGAKVEMPLSRRALLTIAGDAGGGGANLDYQIVGLLGFKLKHGIVLQGGWRYLVADYRPNEQFFMDTASSGLVLGATFGVR